VSEPRTDTLAVSGRNAALRRAGERRRGASGPADIFGSSGGAINSLVLVAKHPELVRTLAAHEPPPVTFPGGHDGFVTDPGAFAAVLRTVLDG